MRNKRLLKIFVIILGVIMSFGFEKIQATEITSIFAEGDLTRSNLQNVAESMSLANASLEPVDLQISATRESENKYTWNPNTTGELKTVWKIAEVDSSNTRDYSNLYYCLNATRGFGISNGDMAEGAVDRYTNNFDMKISANKENIINYAGGKLGTNYNKILWILDNSYIPTGATNYQKTEEYISLMRKASIEINDDERGNLTEDDIEVVQQMAIWYFTNSDNSSYNNTNLPSLYLNNKQLSSIYLGTDEHGTQITGALRQNKAEKLYKYYINNALSNYVSKIPSLDILNTNVTVTESGSNYILGPYSFTGSNLDKINKIEATVSVEYALLDSEKVIVNNNDFSKVLTENFYLQIPKSEITQSTQITLGVVYKYDYRTLTFMTDSSDLNNNQAVVKVKNDVKEDDPSVTDEIEIISIEVDKKWEDANNQDGVQPKNVKVQLYKNGEESGSSITLNSSNNWKHTWTKLLKGPEYTIKELNANGDKVENNEKYNDDYIASYVIEGNKTTITNTHKPEQISKTVSKIWDDNRNQDGIRPTTVKITLFKTVENVKEKIEEIELNSSNEWKYTWDDLDKYENGEEITYTVDETVPNGYIPSYSNDTFTITNKYTPGVISKTIVKQWNDQDNVDGIRTSSVTVQLYADGKEYGEEVVLNKSNGWTHTWTNLPEKEDGVVIDYTVSEIKIGKEEVKNNSAAGYNVTYEVEGNIITVTNKHIPEKTGKTVTKIWDDNNNKNNTRPNSIKIQLYSNGKQYGEPITLTSGNDKIWQTEELKYTWMDLPLNESGEEITYTVKELDKDGNIVENGEKFDAGYITIYSEDTFTITNTYKQFDLALRKFITQINDELYKREPVVDTSTIAPTGTATYKHSKTPIAVQRGDIVTYTIRVYNEGEVDGYVNEITDYLPENLLPIIEGIEGIDSEKYKEEIEFNNNWLWEFSGNGETVKTKITEADKASNLPGISEDKQEDTRLLEAYVDGYKELDYIDVQIKCLVTDEVESNEYLTNIAEITDSQDINGNVSDGNDSELDNVDHSNLSDYKNEEAIESTKDSYIAGQEDDDDFEKLVVKEFDLSLRKFITKVNETSHSREPIVDTSKLGTIVNDKLVTTAIYSHTKEPVIVETDDVVTYTIRIYNEGSLAGYANEITDDIPKGLEFISNSDINISYKWKMLDSEGNETEDVSKAVMIVTDYLSDNDENNIINPISEINGVKTLSYKDVKVQFKVVAKAEKQKDNIIINEAQISADSNRDIDSVPNRDEKYDYTSGNNEDDIDYEPVKLKYFDLALRKFITKVNAVDYNNRYPEVKYNDDGSITYNHTKDPVLVSTEDIVVYTIRVYNEGEKSGYATEIIDNLPDGLEFVSDNEINKQYGWKLIDSQGNVTEELEKSVKASTDYLKNEIIDALVIENGSRILTYKDVKIAFKVVEPNTSDRILVNTAEISNDSDEDVDSIPGNDILSEDDIDREYVKVQYFDLSLKKWVTKTQVTYNGKTTTTKTGFTEDSEDIAKVDLVASKMNKTTVKFTYSIKVTNEGELPGYAYEVKDYIPNGLKFVAADNKDWKEAEDGKVVTDKLKDTLLNPGESATVEIVLTWKNSTTNTGLKTNYAEITKDSADDIDSTPDNYNKKEDDIDDAQVILSIKTAGPQTYIGLILVTVAILAGGIFLIKKYVIEE